MCSVKMRFDSTECKSWDNVFVASIQFNTDNTDTGYSNGMF